MPPTLNKPSNYNPRTKGVIHKPKARRGKETQNQSSAPPPDTNNHSTGMILPVSPPTKANPINKAPPPVLFKDIDSTDIIQDSDIQNTDKQNTDDTAVCKIVNTLNCAETDKSPPTGEETVTKTLPDKIACANSCRKPLFDTLEELLTNVTTATPTAKKSVTPPSTTIENDTQNTPGDNLPENI